MSNATNDIPLNGMGQDGRRFHMPVKASAAIKSGTMVAQMVSTGMLVAATTAGAGPAIGKATHTVTGGSADGDKRCEVETERIYRMANATSTDAFSEVFQIGAPCYALDDHTVQNNDASGTLQQCGVFMGMESDGMVRVLMSARNQTGALKIQTGTATFAAGVKAISAGITVTATSRFFFTRANEAGTDGDEIRCPTADRTVGGPGTGAFTARSFLSGVAATSDTSTFEYLIIG